jgi:ankyrin repeat protein
VKINGYDESGTTALHFAASSSNVFAAGHFIEMGAKPNLFNNTGHSPLYLAAEISNTEMTDLLLEV